MHLSGIVFNGFCCNSIADSDEHFSAYYDDPKDRKNSHHANAKK